MKKRRLIVLSVDAMVYEDLAYIRTLPHFSMLFDGGSRVERVRSVYPSITYPAHTTMSTGCWPHRHGIVNNEKLDIGNLRPDWEWFASAVQTDTILDAAKRAGYTTCAVNWPVTGISPSVDYLVNEIWSWEDGVDPVALHRAHGSSPETLRVVARHAPILEKNAHPQIDLFGHRCAADLLREFQPEVLLLHQAYVDNMRHRTGLFNDQVREALRLSDEWFGELVQAARDAGVFEETDFVVTSDHGQLDIKRILSPNVALADRGFLQVGPDGAIERWDAYCKSAGMSAQVYLRPGADERLYQRVYDTLRDLCDEGIYGISRVFTRAQADAEQRLAGDFSFVLETDGYTSFSDRWQRPMVTPFDLTDYKYGRATHGHLPEKGPQPPFLVWGPHFAENVVLPEATLADEAPTYAALLGVELPQAEGSALWELLRERPAGIPAGRGGI